MPANKPSQEAPFQARLIVDVKYQPNGVSAAKLRALLEDAVHAATGGGDALVAGTDALVLSYAMSVISTERWLTADERSTLSQIIHIRDDEKAQLDDLSDEYLFDVFYAREGNQMSEKLKPADFAFLVSAMCKPQTVAQMKRICAEERMSIVELIQAMEDQWDEIEPDAALRLHTAYDDVKDEEFRALESVISAPRA